MEPITHFLTGACLGRTGFNRKTALATATMTLAAEAPDLDVFTRFRGPVFGLAHHRGFTHSLLGLIFISLLVVAFMYGVWRLLGRKTNHPNLPARWGLLLAYAYVAGLSHILLDFTNGYGVRPFWPVSERWYSWDIVFIVDPVMLAVLFLGLVLPWLGAVISEEIGAQRKGLRGQRAAIMALVAVALLWLVRDYEHRRALNALEARTYEQADPVRVGAYPTWGNPFSWYGVVETSNAYALPAVNSQISEVDRGGTMQVLYKPEETPITLAAKRSRLGRVYLDWARFPITQTEPMPHGGYIVRFYDLRFAGAWRGRDPPLSAGVVLDRNLRVVEEFFGRNARQVAPD